MEAAHFRRWELDVDREATRQAHADTEVFWAEYCGCTHCRNFKAARGGVCATEIRLLLDHRFSSSMPRQSLTGYFGMCNNECDNRCSSFASQDTPAEPRGILLRFRDRGGVGHRCGGHHGAVVPSTQEETRGTVACGAQVSGTGFEPVTSGCLRSAVVDPSAKPYESDAPPG